MKQTITGKSKGVIKYLWLLLFHFSAVESNAQLYEQRPEPEIGLGIKVIKGKIIYGPKSYFITDPNSIALQALVRHDGPLRISSYSPYQQRYISFVLESGFLFCKANQFDSVFKDTVTNIITREKSRNPTYLPVYMGLYSRSVFCVGAEVFYWKGLGAKDIWGAKFLSLGYNARQFRITASGEWHTQTGNRANSGIFYSVDFLWKLIVSD